MSPIWNAPRQRHFIIKNWPFRHASSRLPCDYLRAQDPAGGGGLVLHSLCSDLHKVRQYKFSISSLCTKSKSICLGHDYQSLQPYPSYCWKLGVLFIHQDKPIPRLALVECPNCVISLIHRPEVNPNLDALLGCQYTYIGSPAVSQSCCFRF
jgi:hypothetical protein